MSQNDQVKEQLSSLAAHLAARRSALLNAWRTAAEADTQLTTHSALSRVQFYDHIPLVLDAFEQRLCATRRAEVREADQSQREGAAGHGLHRWHQGYQQREVMREWRHLHLCLVEELEEYAAANSDLAPEVLPTARRALALLCSEGVCESADQYARLQQADAAGRVSDLERGIEELKQLDRQRAELWREAAHDLRGNLGVVRNATTVLPLVPERERKDFQAMLERGVASLGALLDDLMTLARLEAGRERRHVKAFDVSVLLGELCANLQPLADQRGLFLKTAGPDTLPVHGDPVKTQRIAQNLVLNGLKYTQGGGVRVSWAFADDPGPPRWSLTVQDTGPGFEDGAVAPLAHAIKEATDEAQRVEDEVAPPFQKGTQAPPLLPTSQTERSEPEPTGEGVGLSIVKRLCELLDATLELQTAPGKGSTFRVIFPREYETAHAR